MQIDNCPYKVGYYRLSYTPTYEPGFMTLTQNHLAFMQNNEMPKIIVYKLSDILNNTSATPPYNQLPTTDQPTSMRYQNLYNRNILVVTCIDHVYLFNENGDTLLFQYKDEASGAQLENKEHYLLASCVGQHQNSQQFLIIGSSINQLTFIYKSQEKDDYMAKRADLPKTRVRQISTLEGVPSKHQLFVCDQEGQAHLFSTAQEEMKLVKTLCLNQSRVPITCSILAVFENSQLLVCGDFQGKVTLVDTNEFILYAQINAHVRLVTHLGFIPSHQSLVSVSEDSYINFWSVKNNGVDLENSFNTSDQMIMSLGVTEKAIIVLAYESIDLTLLNF